MTEFLDKKKILFFNNLNFKKKKFDLCILATTSKQRLTYIKDIVNQKQYTKFKEWFESHEIKILSSDIPFLPKEHVIINSKQFNTIGNLIEALEELEDVHDVYTNFDISEKEFQSILK